MLKFLDTFKSFRFKQELHTKFSKNFKSLYSKNKMASKQTEPSNKVKLGIFWFRNDLRLNDNTALNQAIKMINEKKIDKILPFFCFDRIFFHGKSRQTKLPRCGPFRHNFQIESVLILKENLMKKLISNLYIANGSSVDEILKLIDKINLENKDVKVEAVIAGKEIPSEEIDMENSLKTLLNQKKIDLVLTWDQTMIHVDDLPFNNINKLPDMFTQFRRLCETRGKHIQLF